MAIISPSLLSADFGKLNEEMQAIVDAGSQFVHFDVMDGHFVPNISFGSVVLKSINHFNITYDVHLMISDPDKYAIDFAKAGADYITFHYEAVENPINTIKTIKQMGVKVGISIKPQTNVEVLDDLLPLVDMVLVMSVEPGFGGQKFIPSALEKIKYLHQQKKKFNLNFLIEVDGGINLDTARQSVEAGAEVLVAGSYIFGSKNIKETIEGLMKLWLWR